MIYPSLFFSTSQQGCCQKMPRLNHFWQRQNQTVINSHSLRTIFFHLTALSLTMFIVCSCDQKIDIDLSEYENTVVVQCILQPGQQAQVLLTATQPLLGESEQQQSLELVLDAEVSIRHENEKYELQHSGVLDYFQGYTPIPGTDYDFDLSFQGLIFYKANIPIIPGETYRLEINHRGRTIKAQTRIPEPVQIDRLEMGEYQQNEDGEAEVVPIADIWFTDRASEENAYIYDVHFVADRLVGEYIYESGTFGAVGYEFTDTIATPIYWKVWEAFRTDDGLDGEQQSIRVWPPSYLSGVPTNVTDTMHIETSLAVDIRLYTAHRDLKRYMQSLMDQPWVPQTPFVEPIRIWSNIEGANGIFTSVALSDVKTFEYMVAYE